MRSRSQAVQQPQTDVPRQAAQQVVREFQKSLDEAVRPKDGPWAEPLGVHGAVKVAFGKESFFPLKYQGFDVGPVEVSVDVQAGESAEQAYRRARAIAEEFFLREFEEKCRGFAERVKTARDKAGA